MRTLNIIGCGSVGRTLGRLWIGNDVLEVQSVLNRSVERAVQATDFMGGGRAVASWEELEPAELCMIATSDDSIEDCCRELAGTGILRPGDIVFHCSGSMPSTVLAPAEQQGALIAGLHPVKSFADPASSVETFPGTWCAVEGDARAIETLCGLVRKCGAQTFEIQPEFKAVYHAATVFVCNYFIALMEVGRRCFEKAGVPRETALEIMQPIVNGTAANLFRLGPAQALTGPIARGEEKVVTRQHAALADWDASLAELYRRLGTVTCDLSAEQGTADAGALERIREMLD